MEMVKRSIVIAVAVFAAMTTSAFASELGTAIQVGPQALAQKVDISLSQAEQDLQTQRTAGNIVPKLEQALGAHYGGVWFDLQTGEFHVGVLSQLDQESAESVMDGSGVLNHTEFEKVKDSMTTVEAAAKDLEQKLAPLVEKQQAMVFADPRIHGVTVELAANISSDAVAQTEALASSVTGTVRVVPIVPSTLELKGDSCSFPYCERPVRGGVGIISTPEHSTYHLCTAGFFVRDANNYPYILTAGHCVYPEKSTYWREPWGTAYPGGKVGCGLGRMIAQVLGTSGDAAVIETEGCEPPAPEPDIAVWGMEESYYIKPEPFRVYAGYYECHIGQTSKTQCGNVEASNITVAVNYSGEGKGTIDVEHEDWLCATSEAGDSGGPYAYDNYGTAIETAGAPGCSSFGYELSYALTALGVHLPTS